MLKNQKNLKKSESLLLENDNFKLKQTIAEKTTFSFQKLKFFMLNVGGLMSKVKTEDLFDSIESYDIVGFLECKIDKTALEGLKNKFGGFELFANVECELSNKPRGGILILVKKAISKFITYLPIKSNMAAYFKINKSILESEKDLICGFVYVPPHTSPFSVSENFDTLENELGEIRELKVSNLLLFGDFNAKTRDIEDCLSVNNYDAFLTSKRTRIFLSVNGQVKTCMKLICMAKN